MNAITSALLEDLRLESIDAVTFYKRDEITTDLICCDVGVEGKIWTFHEELPGWPLLIEHLGKLPGFNQDWYGEVVKPAFAPSITPAYRKAPA